MSLGILIRGVVDRSGSAFQPVNALMYHVVSERIRAGEGEGERVGAL